MEKIGANDGQIKNYLENNDESSNERLLLSERLKIDKSSVEADHIIE